jgi:von Willebrand factor type A domain/PEP-CTERM motif
MTRANWINVSLLALLALVGANIGAVRPAGAAPIQTALSIVIDGSGSISAADFATQKTAYATVLGSMLPTDGSVVVNVIQFSTAAQVEQTALRISSAANLTTLITSINNMTQLGANTAIGDGINLGRSNMDALLAGLAGEFAPNFKKIIDVSTDGVNNTGADPTTAAQNAFNNVSPVSTTGGYAAINCLGIGAAANCNFNNGVGGDFPANSFAELQPVLAAKIAQEVVNTPEPTTLGLLGVGLLGLGFAARLRRKGFLAA